MNNVEHNGSGKKVIHPITPMSFDPIIDNNFLQVKASKIRIRSTKIRINLVVNIIIAVDMDKGIGQNV